MGFFLCVLLTERHCAQSDFANFEVRVSELSVLQRGLLGLLGSDGCFDGAPPPEACSGSGFGGKARAVVAEKGGGARGHC